MLAPEEAWQRLTPYLAPLAAQEVERRAAAGRVLSEDLAARVDVPGCDVSAMDGYAIGTPAVAGTRLAVTGTVAAGTAPGRRLAPGTAVRIMTGAPVPQGADRVIPVEDTDGGTDSVVFRSSPEPGAHIRCRGEIVRQGEPILPRSCLLMPGTLGLVATHGYKTLPVVRQARVSVLTTGDEVVAPESDPQPGQLRDSHTDFLSSAVTSVGARVEPLGIAPDREEVLLERIEKGLESDVLLVSGGASMGEFDLVEGALVGLGCELLFQSVAIQPGKPAVAARHPRGLVFGLPGNPASAMVTFWLFVRPTLRLLMGLEDGFWHGALNGRLTAPLPPAGPRDRFLPAAVQFEDGEILVHPFVPKGSHDLFAYARGSALVRIRANSPETSAGACCQVLPLADWPVPKR